MAKNDAQKGVKNGQNFMQKSDKKGVFLQSTGLLVVFFMVWYGWTAKICEKYSKKGVKNGRKFVKKEVIL